VAKNLVNGDLVSRSGGTGELFIVIGFTYRVSRWGNRRLMRLFCSMDGSVVYILEDQLVVVNHAENKSDE